MKHVQELARQRLTKTAKDSVFYVSFHGQAMAKEIARDLGCTEREAAHTLDEIACRLDLLLRQVTLDTLPHMS